MQRHETGTPNSNHVPLQRENTPPLATSDVFRPHKRYNERAPSLKVGIIVIVSAVLVVVVVVTVAVVVIHVWRP